MIQGKGDPVIRAKIDRAHFQAEEISSLYAKGTISESLKDYARNLIVLDLCAWEADTLAKQGMIEEACKRLAFARRVIDDVYEGRARSISPGKPFDIIGKRIPLHQQALIDEAKSRYDNAVLNVEQILGAQQQ